MRPVLLWRPDAVVVNGGLRLCDTLTGDQQTGFFVSAGLVLLPEGQFRPAGCNLPTTDLVGLTLLTNS